MRSLFCCSDVLFLGCHKRGSATLDCQVVDSSVNLVKHGKNPYLHYNDKSDENEPVNGLSGDAKGKERRVILSNPKRMNLLACFCCLAVRCFFSGCLFASRFFSRRSHEVCSLIMLLFCGYYLASISITQVRSQGAFISVRPLTLPLLFAKLSG